MFSRRASASLAVCCPAPGLVRSTLSARRRRCRLRHSLGGRSVAVAAGFRPIRLRVLVAPVVVRSALVPPVVGPRAAAFRRRLLLASASVVVVLPLVGASMIRVEGFAVDGYADDFWTEDDGDVGDWQSLLSQGIATVGTIVNNRYAARAAAKGVIGLGGAQTVSTTAWQPVPGASVFPPAPAPQGAGMGKMGYILLAAAGLGVLVLLRR